MQKLIVCLFTTMFLYSCGGDKIGKQPPENVILMASVDGAVVARQYSVFNVVSYKQEGGKIERHGSSKNYLEIYNGATGQLLSSKPYATKENCRLLKVTNTHAWLRVYSQDMSAYQLMALEIPSFTKAYDGKALAEKNGGLIFKANYTYYNPPGIAGMVVQADDARIYAIDELTGLATVLPDTVETKLVSQTYIKMNNIRLADRYLGFAGNQRKKITAKMNDRKNAAGDMQSEVDFINPYIAAYYNAEHNKEMPLSVQEGFLVVSKTRDSNAFEFQFTLLDSTTLKTNWSAILKNDKPMNNDNDLLDIQLQEHGILVITKNSMSLLDAKTGNWKWSKSFDQK